MKSASSRGLTLIELMVTVAVLGMMLLVLMPSMSDWIRNSRVRNAAESVQNGMQKARMEAMRRNTNVTFWLVSVTDPKVVNDSCALSSTAGSWVVSVDNPASHCSNDPSTTASPRIVETHAAADGGSDVTIAALAADGATAATSVTFNGFGQMVNGSSDISRVDFTHSTSSGTRRLRVTVASGGSIRTCDRDAPSGDPRYCPTTP